MKFFLLVSLAIAAVVAEPEAKPEADAQYYNTYGYNTYSPYVSTYGAYPYSSYASSYVSPYTNFGYNRLYKREAESKPELVYTDGTFHTNVANLQKGVNNQYVKPYGAVYNTVPTVAYQQPATVYAAAPVAAAYQPAAYAAAPAAYRLYKREAEAEAKPEAQFYYGNTLGYSYGSPLSYTSAYSAYPYASAYSTYPYSSYGHFLGKREADAEPQYYSYGAYTPYAGAYSGYSSYPYNTYSNYNSYGAFNGVYYG